MRQMKEEGKLWTQGRWQILRPENCAVQIHPTVATTCPVAGFFFYIDCPSSLLWLKHSRKWGCIIFVTTVCVFHLLGSPAWQVRAVSQMVHGLLCLLYLCLLWPTDLQPSSNLSIPHRLDQAQLNSLADSLIYPGGNCSDFQVSSSILPLNKCLLFLDRVSHV